MSEEIETFQDNHLVGVQEIITLGENEPEVIISDDSKISENLGLIPYDPEDYASSPRIRER